MPLTFAWTGQENDAECLLYGFPEGKRKKLLEMTAFLMTLYFDTSNERFSKETITLLCDHIQVRKLIDKYLIE